MEISRREFLRLFSSFSITSLLSSIFISSDSYSSDRTETKHNNDSCNDLKDLSQSDKFIRKTLNYVDNSPYQDRSCHNCLFWIEPETKKQLCGKCKILAGPVYSKGYCDSWKSLQE